jgi:pimeloyl-ACP methyl ester carboxylesterase
MPEFQYGTISIHFEVHGAGFPILLIAPGGMESAIGMWESATIDPLALYADTFQLIAMDQRNAGRSYGPLDLSNPWGSYADDQLALLDHLGIDQFHVMGACIGGPFALKLIEKAPTRVTAAVLAQPVGVTADNRPLYEQMWRSWANRLSSRPDLNPDEIEEFGKLMWSGDFVLSVSRDFVRSCRTPLLVLPGTDRYHPTAAGHEIAELAPSALVIEPWNDSQEHAISAASGVRRFLVNHSPR